MATLSEALLAAVGYHQAGRYDEAETLYRRILDVVPENPDALHLLGVVLRRRGLPDQAVPLMIRAIANNPLLDGVRFNLGSTLAELGRHREAARIFRTAIALQPADPSLYMAMGQALIRDGWHANAVAALAPLTRLTPDAAPPWFNLASAYQGMGDLETAAAAFTEALARDPAQDHAWVNLGVLRHLQGRLDDALSAHRRALALSPSDNACLLRTGQAQMAKGRPDLAETVLRRALPSPEVAEVSERARRYRALSAARQQADLPTGLAIRGTFRDTSGYSLMVRQFVRQLHGRGVPIHLMDVRMSFLPPMDDGHRDPLFETLDAPVRARSMLNFAIPTVVEPVPGMNSLAFSMFEARTVPRNWLPFSQACHHIIVPTPSSAEAWIDAGYPADRISLCPLGVDPAPQAGSVTPMVVSNPSGDLLSNYRVRIANVSDFTPRKNLDGLIRAWVRATHRGDDAALVLKIGKGTPGEEARISAFLHQEAAAVGRPLEQAAPIFVVSGRFSDEEMMALMAGATHYWSMSHGEGWDLPMTQAGAMGLGLIAPRHSAYLGYLDDSVATLLPCRIVPAHPSIPYTGLEWWEPDEDTATEIVRTIVQGTAGPALSARQRLAEDFSWSRSTGRLLEILNRLDAI